MWFCGEKRQINVLDKIQLNHEIHGISFYKTYAIIPYLFFKLEKEQHISILESLLNDWTQENWLIVQ